MFTLTVTAEEINIIGAGLGELPLKVSGPLAAKLQAQVDDQERQKQQPVVDDAAIERFDNTPVPLKTFPAEVFDPASTLINEAE